MSKPKVINNLNISERDCIKDQTRAYTPAELLVVVESIPSDYLWDELVRRNTEMLGKINDFEEILGVSLDNIRPIPIKAWEDIRGRYDDIKNKYRKIREGLRVK